MDIKDLQESITSTKNDHSLFEKSKQYSIEYMESISTRPVFPDDSSLADLNRFNEELQEAPSDPHELLTMLHNYGSPATVAQTGGRYFGFVNGNILPSALAVKWLADTWDQNPALYIISPIVAQLEMVCEKWLVELLGLPDETAAGFVSGSSTATLCGLAAGRDSLLAGKGWDAQERGLIGAPNIKVVAGAQAHATVFKALSLLGLGRDRAFLVPADDQGCIIPEKIPELDDSTLLILQAGNVNSGGFDAFEDLCAKARAAGAWTHVDGAFGLWAACSCDTKHLTRGIELADSWSLDAHKTLNAPYDCGIVLCKSRDALISSMQASGSYIQYSDNRDSMLYTPEMSRRSRGVDLWATLKSLGKNGIGALVSGLNQRAVQMATELESAGFQVLNQVVFNQVLVACDSDELTIETLKGIQKSGECWAGGAKWLGKDVIRLSICSWATTSEDIKRSVQAFILARANALTK
ncbi:MAG: pyridoxal phosphate-dependent decarboxylase family protein [Desulforhopalus sp.]